MPWIGSSPTKTFERTDGTRTGTQTWQEADAAGIDIVSDDHDTHDQDVADGLSQALLKDGGNTATANIPMGAFRFTNLGDAAALTQALTAKQQLNNAVQYCAVSGSANAITLSTGFTATAYVAGMTLSFKVGTTNTGATTVNVDGLGSKALVRADGANTALAAGDLASGSMVEIQYDGTRFQLRSSSIATASSDVLARIVRAGSVVAWTGATVPAGWLECQGQSLLRASYPELFANIGTTFGAADGDHFTLPDIKNRTIFGQDGDSSDRITTAECGIDGDTLGAVGGLQSVTIEQEDLPNVTLSGTTSTDGAHTHTYQRRVSGGNGAETGSSFLGTTDTINTSSNGDHSHTFVTSSLNGGVTQTTVNNMPPAIILKWIILALPAAASAGTLGVHGFQYAWNTATSGDPGVGSLLVNNATLASATAFNISETDANGSGVGAYLATLDDSTSTIKGFFHVSKVGAPGDYMIYGVTGSITDSGDYDTFAVSHVASNGTFSSGDSVAVIFYRTGDKGDTGEVGTSTGIRWAFDDGTSMADPGTGNVRLDNATLSSVTAAAVSDLCGETGNPDVSAWVLAWDDSTSSIRGTLKIKSQDAPENFAIYNVTGASTDNSGWTQIALTYVTHAGSFADGDVIVVDLTASGDVGDAGVTGTDAGIRFAFDDSTSMADPGAGEVRFNNASFASTTAIAVSDLAAETGTPDVSAWVLAWDDSTTTDHRGMLTIKRLDAPENFAIYDITDNSTDNSGWTQIAVTHVASDGSFSDGDELSISFTRTGDKGTDGLGAGDVTAASAFATDNVVIRSDGTSKGVQSTGISVDDSNNVSGIAALSVTSIELGHATQNTLTASGGNLSIEGNVVYRAGGTDVAIADGGTGASTAEAAFTALKQAATDEATGVVELATDGEAQTGSATDKVLTPANLTAAAVKQGKHTIYVPASGMVPNTTNGPAVGLIELSTNKNMIFTLDFDQTTSESAQFEIAMPKSWNDGTVTFEPIWSHPSTTTNFGAVFALSAVARSNDDACDVAFGTAQNSADTGGTTDDLYVGPESSAITVAGTPAAGDVVQFKIARLPADGSDTLAVDARLHGIRLFYTINTSTDA